jgi:hypothetical protein
MNGRWLLALLVACALTGAATGAEAPAAPADGSATALGTETPPAADALTALEQERMEAIEAFDWGQRADFGVRLLDYNRLLRDFDLRELALRADWHEAQGRPQEAARLRAEREVKLAAVPPQPQAVPHAAPGAAEEVTQ